MHNGEVMGPQSVPDPYARPARSPSGDAGAGDSAGGRGDAPSDGAHAPAAATRSRPGVRTPAAVLAHTQPEVAVTDDGEVYLQGVMYHSGLNKNAWGLDEDGARAIAESLVDADLTAGHPELRPHPERGWVYDRALHENQGAPIGRVVDTDVVDVAATNATATGTADVDSATAPTGGTYTATYAAEVRDDRYRERYQNGVYAADTYSVSVGIYADPEDATCAACGAQMTECDHERFDEIERDDASDDDAETVIAGPIYSDGEGDHLAAVYLPAYDGATASVAAADDADSQADAEGTATTPAHRDHVRAFAHAPASGRADRRAVLPASAVLAAPFDTATPATAAAGEPADDSADDSAGAEADDATTRSASGYPVRVPAVGVTQASGSTATPTARRAPTVRLRDGGDTHPDHSHTPTRDND